jgi:hypothetical protein
VNIFDYGYLLMPIHEGPHWSLIVICHPRNVVDPDAQGQACILHLDSMDGEGGAVVDKRRVIVWLLRVCCACSGRAELQGQAYIVVIMLCVCRCMCV